MGFGRASPCGGFLLTARHGHATRQALPLRHLWDRDPLQQGGDGRHHVLRSRDEGQGGEAAPVVRLSTPAWLLENARVVTLDPSRPLAEAIAVGGGRVLAVGTGAALRRLAGRRTERVDC